ncbi:MAG: threonylcarbamoyl-AMP synthase [Planctomycetes bacterium]|nr:threonylcarbamoyl-AMP synthase [Planctomycetota bacterium]
MARSPEVAAAVQRLKEGGLVAFPTETVYGLGADALSEQAVRAVFELKGRPAQNPLIVHVADAEMAKRLVTHWGEDAAALAKAYWPGPLSIVLPKASIVPGIVTGGGLNVAVRCPDHPLTLELLREFGGPLVGPSANLSGRLSPTAAEHVKAAFAPQQVLVLDGGPCRVGIESTVVSLAGSGVRVLRPGIIGANAIAKTLGKGVTYDDGPRFGVLESPGLLPSHYAPAARTVLAKGPGIAAAVAAAKGDAVVLVHGAAAPSARRVIILPAIAVDYASSLYAAMREADECHPSVIVVEEPTPTGDEDERAVWHAVLDRLRRAAA